MTKIKLLGIFIIALLVLNLITISFLFLDHGGKHKEPRKIIIEQLHFDSKQQKEYEKLIQNHRRQINNLEREIKDTKKELYFQLSKNKVDSTKKNTQITRLSVLQKQIEITHFNHFMEIKKICRSEQLDDFKELTSELAALFSHSRPPKQL
mgnify:CR=1 FL=1